MYLSLLFEVLLLLICKNGQTSRVLPASAIQSLLIVSRQSLLCHPQPDWKSTHFYRRSYLPWFPTPNQLSLQGRYLLLRYCLCHPLPEFTPGYYVLDFGLYRVKSIQTVGNLFLTLKFCRCFGTHHKQMMPSLNRPRYDYRPLIATKLIDFLSKQEQA